jgi:hypothetical protein
MHSEKQKQKAQAAVSGSRHCAASVPAAAASSAAGWLLLELPEPPHAIREMATVPASRAANNLFFMLHPPIL